jgi:hypothetical protein
MKRSILTEKVARRGYHLFREYIVDPLESSMVDEIMTRNVMVVPEDLPIAQLKDQFFHQFL